MEFNQAESSLAQSHNRQDEWNRIDIIIWIVYGESQSYLL